MLASEQDRPDVARKRVRWKRYQGAIDPQHLVFIDETWTKTNMALLRGWGKRGHRLQAKAPFGHWNTMTPDQVRGRLFLAALRHDRIDAPWVFDGPVNAEVFRTYVEKVLVPTLHPGDIVILDNLGSHKAPAIRAAIRAAGARLWFLPPYSPDLNPIDLRRENGPPDRLLILLIFAKLKHLLRKAAERSKETLWRKIGDLLALFSPQECANYLTNSGYASVKT